MTPTKDTHVTESIETILSRLQAGPVLLDIGASGEAPPLWRHIAPWSTIVGFDPDARGIAPAAHASFKRGVMVRKAVTSEAASEVTFHLTRFPACSSTLAPDTKALGDYLFADLFDVERQVTVPAITLDAALQEQRLTGIDWFKADSQGTDLRLFNDLNDDMRKRVLAVDVEPGLIDAYVHEDLFTDVHRNLLMQGFWLSDLTVRGSVRIRPSTARMAQSLAPEITRERIEQRHKPSPGWCEARYLRTIDSIGGAHATEREYALLWVFAMLDRQVAFALDVTESFRVRYAENEMWRLMRDHAIAELRRLALARTPADGLPRRIARRIRRMLCG